MHASKLDDPVWHSLAETHKAFALEYGGTRFYRPEFCPFGSTSDASGGEALNEYAQLTPEFYIVGSPPRTTGNIRLQKELVCLQMVLDSPSQPLPATETVELGPQNAAELFALVDLVQPGYFRPRTREMGSYFGIYKEGILVAVTGERMKMEGFTEISAVVTHPQHTGNGYAQQLVSHTAHHIQQQGRLPYLHVAGTNARAIRLYELLGFRTRRKMSFWHFVRK